MRVYEYLDGELTVWRRRAITRHLDECPPCADGFTFEIEIRRIVVSKCREEVPADAARRGSPSRSGSQIDEPDPRRVLHRCARFYDGADVAGLEEERVRPSEIMMLIAGVVVGAGRRSRSGICVFVDHNGGEAAGSTGSRRCS